MIVAVLSFLVSGFLLAMLTFPRQRTGPEGPVGFHLVTAPLALGQTGALGIALLTDAYAATGFGVWALLPALPGHFLAWVVLPVLAIDRRNGWMARVGGAVGLVGAAALLFGSSAFPSAPGVAIAGLASTWAIALFGYGLVLALLTQNARNRIAAAKHYAERQNDFERRQAEWQAGEWKKLPESPGLWQLIQFTHAFDDDVAAQARAKAIAMPDLEAATIELLGTGWAEHSLRFLRDVYPHSMAPLAPAFAKLLDEQAERWRKTLSDGSNPGSWYGNLAGYLEVAERVVADGGDLRASMSAWAAILHDKRGLEALVVAAQRLAKVTPTVQRSV